MIDERAKEQAAEALRSHKIKHDAFYRGIPVSEFDYYLLLKIIDIYAGLLKHKDETIQILSGI